jgi:hypothetical protein
MAAGGTFFPNAGDLFGLRVSGGDNLLSCTAEVVPSNADPEMRVGFDGLRAGFTWTIQAGITYTVLLVVVSQTPGQQVSIDVAIPLTDNPATCSRMSSGVMGVWTVVAS